MIPCSVTRGRPEGTVAALLIGVIAWAPSLAGAADQGWAPVVVRAAETQPAKQADPSRGAAKAEKPSRVAKATPIDAEPARPAVPVGPRVAEQSPAPKAAPPEAAKAADARPNDSPPVPAPKAVEAASAEASPAEQYCANIADAAADARFAWQKKTLTEVQHEVDKRIARLDGKIAEYQKWLARRDEFSRKAQASLVSIYSRMRPDAAASQLVKMDEETAAAVLLKLDPRIASTILNEIPAAQAARLTGTISGAARTTTGGKKS